MHGAHRSVTSDLAIKFFISLKISAKMKGRVLYLTYSTSKAMLIYELSS